MSKPTVETDLAFTRHPAAGDWVGSAVLEDAMKNFPSELLKSPVVAAVVLAVGIYLAALQVSGATLKHEGYIDTSLKYGSPTPTIDVKVSGYIDTH